MVDDSEAAAETVQLALDALLTAVEKAAEDLRLFHDTVAGARSTALPRFPRAMVLTTNRIITNLGLVDSELRDVLTALALPSNRVGSL